MSVPIKKGKLEPHEDGYNYYLSQLRVTIECSFGVLVNRWSLLRRPLCFKLERIGPLVMCLCRLHNYCIKCRLRNKVIKIDLKILDEDTTYTMQQCKKHNVNPINLDRNGVPLGLVDDEPAVVDNPYRNVHTMNIPMNQMVANAKKDGIVRPNIILPRSRKVKRS